MISAPPILSDRIRNLALRATPGHPLHQIEFQFAEGQDKLPSEKVMRGWVEGVLDGCEDLELTVRFVGEAEIAALNEQFRQKPELRMFFPSRRTCRCRTGAYCLAMSSSVPP